jgi:hypothetical protein
LITTVVGFTTSLTAKWPAFEMASMMVIPIANRGEITIADVTFVRSVAVVDAPVDFQVTELAEGLKAVGPLALVNTGGASYGQPIVQLLR